MSKNVPQPIHSVRMSDRQRNTLLQDMNRKTIPVAREQERRSPRVEYRLEKVLVTVSHPNGSESNLAVPTRNLSNRGIAFIHGGFLYPGCICQITLPALDGHYVRLTGKIRNCRHVSGLVHEIGVVFDTAIRVEDFVRVCRDATPNSNAAKPAAAPLRKTGT